MTDTDATARLWRVGQHYGIHCYADEEPICTALKPEYAAQIVEDHNAAIAARPTTVHAPVGDERSAFELWCRSRYITALDRNPKGTWHDEEGEEYRAPFVQASWAAWQARATARPAPAPDASAVERLREALQAHSNLLECLRTSGKLSQIEAEAAVECLHRANHALAATAPSNDPCLRCGAASPSACAWHNKMRPPCQTAAPSNDGGRS